MQQPIVHAVGAAAVGSARVERAANHVEILFDPFNLHRFRLERLLTRCMTGEHGENRCERDGENNTHCDLLQDGEPLRGPVSSQSAPHPRRNMG
jgi:hypothetical protein